MSKERVQSDVEALESVFGRNSFLLYAMGLEIGTEDYDALNRDNVLDATGDK